MARKPHRPSGKRQGTDGKPLDTSVRDESRTEPPRSPWPFLAAFAVTVVGLILMLVLR